MEPQSQEAQGAATPAAARPRLWRPLAAGTAIILLGAGLVWFCVAAVVPIWRVRRGLAIYADPTVSAFLTCKDERAFVENLGGPKAVRSSMMLYLNMPEAIAPHSALASYWFRYAGADALPAFERVMRRPETPVRMYAARGLVGLAIDTGDPALVPLLIESLNDPAMEVRREVIQGVEYISPLLSGLVPAMESLFEHESPATRFAAATGLWMATNDGRRPLSMLLGGLAEANPVTRKEAALALSFLGTRASAATPALERAARDPDPEARAAIVHALDVCRSDCVFVATTNWDNSLNKTFDDLADPNWEVRACAVLDLGATCGETLQDAVPALRRAFADENECVRDCAAYALRRFRPEDLAAPPVPLVVAMQFDDNRKAVVYRIGVKPPLAGKDALQREVARKVARRGELSVQIEPFTSFEPIFLYELDAARSACEAAGAKVLSVPELIAQELAAFCRADDREAQIALRAVGVHDGAMQFRVDDRLVGEHEALVDVLRTRIAEIEKDKGGFTLISLRFSAASELSIGPTGTDDIEHTAKKNCPQVWHFFRRTARWGWYYRTVVDSDGHPIPAEKHVDVFIISPCGGGNLYQMNGQRIEGEAALTAALGRELAEFRTGKEGPERFTLSVSLKAEVKPGITATEEQLELARKTVAAAEVEKREAE
jgi:HEAT repeat protein